MNRDIMKALCTLSLLLLLGSAAHAERVFWVKKDGELYGGPNDILKVAGPAVPMTVIPSASGLLFYLRKSEDYRRTFDQTYAFSDGIDKNYDRRYTPDMVSMYLHVLTRDGEERQVIPIEQRYGGWLKEGGFIGERFVHLWFNTRGDGRIKDMLVDLHTNEILVLLSNWPEGDHATLVGSPDGENFAAFNRGIVYVNMKQVYPYFDERPLQASLSPEEYKAKRAIFERWLEETGEDYLLWRPQRSDYDDVWSPDSRYFSFFKLNAERREGKRIYTSVDLVTVDTQKVGQPEGCVFVRDSSPVDLTPTQAENWRQKITWDIPGDAPQHPED